MKESSVKINNQAKNEVKDILNEYVVTPVTRLSLDKLKEISDQMNEKYEEIQKGVNGIAGGIRNQEADLQKLKENIDDSMEEQNGYIDDISNSVDENKKRLEFISSSQEEKYKQLLMQLDTMCQKMMEGKESLEQQIECLLRNLEQVNTILEERTKLGIEKIENSSENISEDIQQLNREIVQYFESETALIETYKTASLTEIDHSKNEVFSIISQKNKILLSVCAVFEVINIILCVAILAM